ncbi:hypothetical protein [Amycolatopsis samaneae]|uniref:Uncharacterized protein n=1 Tax=Amycolatopsis samaneae TaxID=664691 RepID=A0ABW5GHQ0_9PSEU
MRTRETGQPGQGAGDVPSRRPLVLAALAGFAVGGGVFGLLWALSGVHAEALQDARDACAALDRVGAIPDTTRSGASRSLTTMSAGQLHRMTAARELSAAAAEVDPAYQPLADHIDGVSRMVFSLHFNDLSGQRHLAQAEQQCARL